MKKVYIRTDANSVIATGHMMRCLTIANKLRIKGVEVEFLVSDNDSLRLLKGTHYKYVVLGTKWDNLDTKLEIKKITDILKNSGYDVVLLVDSYYVGNDYLASLNGLCKTVIFDDFYDKKYEANLLINY